MDLRQEAGEVCRILQSQFGLHSHVCDDAVPDQASEVVTFSWRRRIRNFEYFDLVALQMEVLRIG